MYVILKIDFTIFSQGSSESLRQALVVFKVELTCESNMHPTSYRISFGKRTFNVVFDPTLIGKP